jgi:hypothetical protein
VLMRLRMNFPEYMKHVLVVPNMWSQRTDSGDIDDSGAIVKHSSAGGAHMQQSLELYNVRV